MNLTRASIVCEHVEIADRAGRRMRGLLGRDSLEPGEGMLLQPAPSIHTWFMRFPIDAVFMDGTLRVMKIVSGLRPWRMAAAHHAWGVVELSAGEAERRGIAIGDQLGVVKVTDRLGAIVAGPGGIGGLLELEEGTPKAESLASVSDEPTASADAPPAGPIHVLLVGSDRRFRSVAAALLTQRGCAVTLGDRSSNVGELAAREGADVVVLDAGVSLTDTAHGVAQLEALDPAVGVVVVGEEAEQSFAAMPVLPKWGSFEVLFGAIKHARPSRKERVTSGSR